MSDPLDCLFDPRSIAIIGASSDPTRVSGRPVQMLRDSGYAGALYPVNPRRDTVQGLKAHPSLDAIGGPVDLALITVPAASVEAALEDCCRNRVGAAIVFGSGFAEIGDEGRAAQERLAAIARAGGVRLLGPNCMGVFNVRSRAYVTFSTVFASGWPEPGNVGLVSQSGAFASFCYARAKLQGLRLSHGVMTGNEADIDFADCLAWMARSPETEVIIGFMEGFADGPKLCAALELARRQRKPVIVLKVGNSPAGIETARSHTAQMAGEASVYDAVFEHYGAHRARTLDELFDLATLASSGLRPARGKLGVVTVSGGAGVLMTDSAWQRDVALPPLSEAAQARLRQRIPFATIHNPVDTTGIILDDATLLPALLEELCAQGEIEAVVGFYAGMGLGDAAPLLESSLLRATADHPAVKQIPCVLCSPRVRAALQAARIPIFDDPDRAIAGFAALAKMGRIHAAEREAPPPRMPLNVPGGALNEAQAKAVVQALGIAVPGEVLARDAGAAAAAARELGFPVAVKILSAALPHKTESGAVALDLPSEEAVLAASRRMLPPENRALQGVPIDGLLVSRMQRGVELILGLRRDPAFGPVVMVGLGGIHAEVLEDRVLALAPVSVAEARGMIERLRGHALLAGHRGQPAADVEAAAHALSALSRADLPAHVGGIEINPLIVGTQGAVAVDALVTGAAP